MVSLDVVGIGSQYFVVYLSCVYLVYISSYLFFCIYFNVWYITCCPKWEKALEFTYRVIGEVLVLGLLVVVYKMPYSSCMWTRQDVHTPGLIVRSTSDLLWSSVLVLSSWFSPHFFFPLCPAKSGKTTLWGDSNPELLWFAHTKDKPLSHSVTLTLTLTRTLWGDQCLDAVACEGSI